MFNHVDRRTGSTLSNQSSRHIRAYWLEYIHTFKSCSLTWLQRSLRRISDHVTRLFHVEQSQVHSQVRKSYISLLQHRQGERAAEPPTDQLDFEFRLKRWHFWAFC